MKLTARYVTMLVFCVLLALTVLTTTGLLHLLDFTPLRHPEEGISNWLNRPAQEAFVDESEFEDGSDHLGPRRPGSRHQRVVKTDEHATPTPQPPVSAEEFRKGAKTGNSLIDDYGRNDLTRMGEQGRGLTFHTGEKVKVKNIMETHRVNVLASDLIPLNRVVPDSRFPGCENKTWDESSLPNASVIIPFHNEWPSILLRTVYSVINRTPRSLLQEVLLLDDVSTLPELKAPLDEYVKTMFPTGLVRLVRFPERVGLIRARQEGIQQARGQVVVIFDSHMEVNIDWLQPLLQAIKENRKTVALSTLDYILAENLEYTWHDGYITRYGFDWRLVFFETFFRPDQFNNTNDAPKVGTVMVGTAYAVEKNYFHEIGGFDDKMKVWGGENLEIAWKVWMCGGRLLHLPCSKVGHIARTQPYNFPEGRRQTEIFNYKRLIEVWMEPEHRAFVYDNFPEMKGLDVGDLSERLAIKQRLHCQNFSWFLDNIWPELFVYNRSVNAWGSARNLALNLCLDNHLFLFTYAEGLFAEQCHLKFPSQGFSWTTGGRLRTSLQCVVVKQPFEGGRPQIEDCITGQKDQWTHVKNGHLKHLQSQLCLDVDSSGPVMKTCRSDVPSQRWAFTYYNV